MATSAAGKSLLEKLWEELDRIMDILMVDGAPEDTPPKPTVEERSPLASWLSEWKTYSETRGQAQGVAYAIAMIESPYHPDIMDVRQRAVERWREANDEEG